MELRWLEDEPRMRMEESMKKNLLLSAAVVALIFASAVYSNAMVTTILRVNVPFAFQVGKTQVPAGAYVVQIERATSSSALGTALRLTTMDGKSQFRVVATPGNYRAATRAALTFNKYADSYFLASVDSYGLGCQVSKSKIEKEVAAKMQPAERASVAAE